MTLASPWLRRQQHRAYAAALARFCLLMSRKPSREPRKDKSSIIEARRAMTMQLQREMGR